LQRFSHPQTPGSGFGGVYDVVADFASWDRVEKGSLSGRLNRRLARAAEWGAAHGREGAGLLGRAASSRRIDSSNMHRSLDSSRSPGSLAMISRRER
jgi:hypothetical protein